MGCTRKIDDTEEKTWRHLDFFQHSAYLTARVAATFQYHRRGILNWWRSQISNGLIEGINSLIQAAIAKTRGSRGYRNPRNLLSIAYLIAGKLDFAIAPALFTSPT